MKIIPLSTALISHTPKPVEHVERCGRVCYKSEDLITPGSAESFIKMLIKRNHGAVLEHASATVHIICDRGVSHETVRHRLAAYCQESTRYCNYAKDKFDGEIRVIEPPFTNSGSREIWDMAMRCSEGAYARLIENGESPQMARSVLPISLKTEICMTCDMREWRHVIMLRTAKTAHPQIVNVMTQALRLFKDSELAPFFFDYEE